MGQSVHIIDLNGRIIYWNRIAEKLYGYSIEEALGQQAIELLSDVQDYSVSNNIVNRVSMKGEREFWGGRSNRGAKKKNVGSKKEENKGGAENER